VSVNLGEVAGVIMLCEHIYREGERERGEREKTQSFALSMVREHSAVHRLHKSYPHPLPLPL